MNEQKQETIQQPKDSLSFRFQRAIDRALLSPILADKQKYDKMKFIDLYDFAPYYLCTGLVVIFLDSAVYGHKYGSYFPYWVLQSAFASKKTPPTNIKLKLLTRRQSDAMVELSNRILDRFEMTKTAKNVSMDKDAISYEFRCPLSENEILKMDKVFQELIRRSK